MTSNFGTRAFVALSLCSCFSGANARACDALREEVPSVLKDAREKAIAKDFSAPAARVLRSFVLGEWHLLIVDTEVSDDAYIFYFGEPSKVSSIAVWGGAAGVDETASLIDWASKQAPGLPKLLATCFAEQAIDRD